MSASRAVAAGDVCIVGGGIVGLATAAELAWRGVTVTVLEAGSIGEHAAAGVAAGMIAPVSEADVSAPELTRFAIQSHREYPDWIARIEEGTGLETGFERTGTLWLAVDRDQRAWLDHLRGFQADRGLETIALSASAVREREPLLSPTVLGGMLAAEDWQVDPRRLMSALRTVVTRHGGTVVEQASVTSLERCNGGWAALAQRAGGALERVEAERFILAPGARGGSLLDPFLPRAGLRPVKGQVLRLRGPVLLRHVVRTPDVYLVPRADGELVIGATVEEAGFDERVTAGAVWELLRQGRLVLPGIVELELVEARAGFRPALRDHLPAIGAVEDALFVAAGHYRNGVALAPLTARLLADLVLDGERDPLLAPFDPLRFASAAAAAVATGATR